MGNQVTIDKEYHNIIYKSNLHWLKLDLKIDTNKIWNEIKLVVNSYKNHKHQQDHVQLKKMTFSAFLRTRAISLSKRFFAKIR